MPVFRNGTADLHYLTRGAGEPLLLIHGLGSSGADWAFQLPALEPGFHVIVPDLPGSGHSDPPADRYTIEGFAHALWALLDELALPNASIVGFSLGGAVALEMALQRPESVRRLVLINSLATYRADHWRKWLEVCASVAVVRLLGMKRTAWLTAARVFPEPWQQRLRDRTISVLGVVAADAYLGMGRGLERWSATERLGLLQCRTLMIAAEHDYTPLAEKQALAARIGAQLLVVRGSRHGTPFDSIALTNAALISAMTDQPLPSPEFWTRDEIDEAPEWPFAGNLADEHAAAVT
jgi:pimeloyl-ACP methyl ester carboxylesterase